MRVIPSVLVLYIGSVTAQEPADVQAVPAVATTTSSSTDPSAQDDPFDDISDFLGDLFGDDNGIGDMIDNIVDTFSDMFGGDGSSVQLPDFSDMDLSDLDFSDLDISNLDLSGLAGDGTSTTSTSQLMDLGCPESCAADNTDLCRIDFSMVMNPDPARVQQMCDTGCIPTAVLEACATVPATATSSAVAGIIASVEGLCDFVNCCVDDGQAADAAVSPTRSKFEQCEGKLPMLSTLPGSATTADPDSNSAISDLFDMGDFDMGDFNMEDVQEIIDNVMEGLEDVMGQFGDILPDMMQGMFDSNSIPAFCADADTCDAPEGFCECFSGDLEKCNKEVIAQACTTDSFSKCAPQDYTDFCANECNDSSGSDVLHMCAMCNVVTCCGKENAEIEGCLSEAFTVAQTEMATMFEDLLDGVDVEGMIGEVLGDLESIKWCPEDKTCHEPFGQFCDIANGGPSSAALDSGSTTDVSPRNNLDLQVIMGIDLDKMCSEDMIFGCGPVNMKEKCDSVCSSDDNDGIMKASFCRICGIASCCESGEEKTFESCSSAVYIPTDSSTPTSGSSQSNNQDSASDLPKEEVPEVVTANAASGAEDVTTENEGAQLDVAQIVEEPQLEFSRLEKENSGMISSASFLTAAFSAFLVLALY